MHGRKHTTLKLNTITIYFQLFVYKHKLNQSMHISYGLTPSYLADDCVLATAAADRRHYETVGTAN